MVNYTSNTYKVKRNILTFSNKISKHHSKPYRKFAADICSEMITGDIIETKKFTRTYRNNGLEFNEFVLNKTSNEDFNYHLIITASDNYKLFIIFKRYPNCLITIDDLLQTVTLQ